MTTSYNATVEVATKIGDDDAVIDELMDALEPYAGTVGMSRRGYAYGTITLPADNLLQATNRALAIISTAFAGVGGVDPIACEVLTTEEFDRRIDWVEVPPLLSVTEAAVQLGVSRQRVLQRINDKSIQAVKVGEGYAIVKSTLNSRPPGRPKKK